MAWDQAFGQVRPYVVRIETMGGLGTGFLFGYNKAHSVAAFATAAHVIDTATEWKQPIKICHWVSKKTLYLEEANRVAWLDRTYDAATILIPAGTLELPSEVLPLLAANKVKKIGVELGWVGFPALAPQKMCFFSGVVSAHIGATDTYLIDGVAINGVSGGPVFCEQKGSSPELIGVVSAYMANRRMGESLPGLLQAQDLTAFHEHIPKIRDFGEAKEKEQEAQKKIEQAKPERETIRIGVSGARIVAVTRQRIDYIDMAGKEQFIDLEESARRLRTVTGSQEFVGLRAVLEDPPWAEFMNERTTRFEFATEGALYAELLGPLQQAGWATFDWD